MRTSTALEPRREGESARDAARVVSRGPSRRRIRVAFHACDGDPSASGYGGLPAREATRLAIADFRRSFGPLVLVGIDDSGNLDDLGVPVVRYRDGRLGGPLFTLLASIPATGR